MTSDDGTSWYAIETETELGVVTGWISADYVTDPASASVVPAAPNGAQSSPAFVAAGGEGLNLRAGPAMTAEIIGGIPDGALVTILAPGFLDDQGIAWSMVSFDGTVGYSASTFLVDAGATETAEPVEPSAEVDLGTTVSAVVSMTGGDGVMLRAEPSSQAGAVGAVFEGTTIQILGDPVADEAGDLWYQTEVDGVAGWMHGAFVSSEATVAGAAAAQSVTLGELFLNEALLYMGTPYVWAGSEPSGFDCSGFTYFIVNAVAGVNFPRAIEEQMGRGEYVPFDELQPGDLVFFENTYTEGLSHVGFYLGDGQFLSATGTLGEVGIAGLYDPYWNERYLTARRLT